MNDLFTFCKVEKERITIFKQALEIFHIWFGLKANNSKSYIFHFGVSQEKKESILSCFQFEESRIPFNYLKVPMISYKLFAGNVSLWWIKFLGGLHL